MYVFGPKLSKMDRVHFYSSTNETVCTGPRHMNKLGANETLEASGMKGIERAIITCYLILNSKKIIAPSILFIPLAPKQKLNRTMSFFSVAADHMSFLFASNWPAGGGGKGERTVQVEEEWLINQWLADPQWAVEMSVVDCCGPSVAIIQSGGDDCVSGHCLCMILPLDQPDALD